VKGRGYGYMDRYQSRRAASLPIDIEDPFSLPIVGGKYSPTRARQVDVVGRRCLTQVENEIEALRDYFKRVNIRSIVDAEAGSATDSAMLSLAFPASDVYMSEGRSQYLALLRNVSKNIPTAKVVPKKIIQFIRDVQHDRDALGTNIRKAEYDMLYINATDEKSVLIDDVSLMFKQDMLDGIFQYIAVKTIVHNRIEALFDGFISDRYEIYDFGKPYNRLYLIHG
jgi:hypothetical protein